MKREKGKGKYIYRGICALLLTFLSVGSFFGVWLEFVIENNQTGHLTGYGNLGMAVGIYTGICFVLLRWMKAFAIGVERKMSTITAVVVGLFTVDVIEVPVSMAITGQWRFVDDFLWRYLLLWIGQAVVCAILTNWMIDIYKKIFPPLQVLEVYGDYHNELDRKILSRADKYHIARRMYYKAGPEEIREEMDHYDAVLINDLPSEEKNRILKWCYDADKRVYVTPKLSDIIAMASEDLNLFDSPLSLCRNGGIGLRQRFVKRFFDIVLSVPTLLVLSPVFLVTAIAIRLEDHGPVFFRQERCTIGGRRFMIIKFRSMIVDAEKDGRPHPAESGDSRITKVGRFIRRTRIDELPQLINILRGEMSIVGPRPERVEHMEKYMEEIPEFRFRLKVKGGLTGYAQVYGKYNTTALDKLKMDLVYITKYSLLLDVQIIFQTIKILLWKESTEGFDKQKAAKLQKEALVLKREA